MTPVLVTLYGDSPSRRPASMVSLGGGRGPAVDLTKWEAPEMGFAFSIASVLSAAGAGIAAAAKGIGKAVSKGKAAKAARKAAAQEAARKAAEEYAAALKRKRQQTMLLVGGAAVLGVGALLLSRR